MSFDESYLPMLESIQNELSLQLGDISSASVTSTSIGRDIDTLITEASQKYGVPASLIKAVIETESSFNPQAVSKVGAKGLMQLMDGTARGLGVTNSFDPAQNIDGGTRYLANNIKRFGGDVNTALAAYNAGPGRLQKLGITNDQQLMEKLHLLPIETQNYIAKIANAQSKYEV
ncbi:Membrane-bound lytic murein transglycosylase C precursor [compost metagenome]